MNATGTSYPWLLLYEHSINRYPEGRSLAFVAIGTLLILIYLTRATSREGDKGVLRLSQIPILGAWNFYEKRIDYLTPALEIPGRSSSFNIRNSKVVVVTGEESRKKFFGHKNFDLNEGYARVYFGQTTPVKEMDPDTAAGQNLNRFSKLISPLIRNETLAKVSYEVFADLDRVMESWLVAGRLNPSEDIYDLVFQLTLRATTASEISNDPSLVSKISRLFWDIERGGCASAILLPWFLSPAGWRRRIALVRLYFLVKGVIDRRIKSGERKKDALQHLLDDGNSCGAIIEFTISALFAGIINTGLSSYWLLIYLDSNREWKKKLEEEVDAFIGRYGTGTGSISSRLAQIPITAWEDELPVMDACISETLRLTLHAVPLRRNMGADLVLGGANIKRGDFMAYPIDDVHLRESFYPDPHRFDPGRYTESQKAEDKAHWTFLGWGAGRHPCPGARFAKLEMKFIAALFMCRFEYRLVNGAGKIPNPSPTPDRNDSQRARPKGEAVYFEYKRTEIRALDTMI